MLHGFAPDKHLHPAGTFVPRTVRIPSRRAKQIKYNVSRADQLIGEHPQQGGNQSWKIYIEGQTRAQEIIYTVIGQLITWAKVTT